MSDGRKEVFLVPDMDAVVTSNSIKESNSTFTCPQNMVMIGRMHHGDENGRTTYKCAPLKVFPALPNPPEITIGNTSSWIDAGKQSKLNYNAGDGYVITGRIHYHDENRGTLFQISQVLVNGKPAQTGTLIPSRPIKESDGSWYDTPEINITGTTGIKCVITGMAHHGDENGRSTYTARSVSYSID